MNNFKVWIVLFGLSSVLFLALGIVLAVVDRNYFDSARFLIVAGLNIYSILTIKRLRPEIQIYVKNIYFGFILTGLGLNFENKSFLPDIVFYIGLFIFITGIISFIIKEKKTK